MSDPKTRSKPIYHVGTKEECKLINSLFENSDGDLAGNEGLSGTYFDKNTKKWFALAVIDPKTNPLLNDPDVMVFIIGGHNNNLDKEEQELVRNMIWNSFTRQGYRNHFKIKPDRKLGIKRRRINKRLEVNLDS